MRVLDLADMGNYPAVKGDEILTEPDGGTFDIILVGMLLAGVDYNDLTTKLFAWASLLNTNGELHAFMPSAEWAAREILGGQLEKPVLFQLYGTPDVPRRSILTLLAMRELFENCGLIVRVAETQEYPIARKDDTGDTILSDRHYLVGVRVQEVERLWQSE